MYIGKNMSYQYKNNFFRGRILMDGEILVEDYRGDVVENVHRGHICGVDQNGNIAYCIGDARHMTYMRSSAKPIQAIPTLKYGFDEMFGYTEEETTILAGSHWGEPFHVKALESIISKLGISENDLVMLPTYPINQKARQELIKSGKPPRKVYHNCSGKHLGILTLCKGMGFDIDKYWDTNHPAQKEIIKYISAIAGYPKQDIKIGIDGCGVPVFAMPLEYLANAYLKLAYPNLINDVGTHDAVVKLSKLMNKNNLMIGGTGTICSTLLSDDNIIAKGGAQGVYCFGLKKERMGFALKVMDGTENNWAPIIASILEQI